MNCNKFKHLRDLDISYYFKENLNGCALRS